MLALVLLFFGLHLVLGIAMACAQDRYLRHYREHHQIDLPLPHERPLLLSAVGLHYRTSKRIGRAYFEPQADPTLERMRRHVSLFMRGTVCNMALILVLFIANMLLP